MKHFLNILKKYPLAQKVGFGIRIDDLPAHFAYKENVIKHENQFWEIEVAPQLYKAKIDTTFALYRPFCGGPVSQFQLTFRTGFPYLIKHLPWYLDTQNLNEEELFYIQETKQSTHWTMTLKNTCTH